MNPNKKSNLIAIFAIAVLYSGTLAFADAKADASRESGE
jgi:hypothetical protein